MRPKSTTLGLDNIPNGLLQLTWPSLGSHLTNLYQLCAQHGWHPKPFRETLLVVLPKSGKCDWTDPWSYRLIALLSTIGRSLERIIARRLAWIAVKYKVLHQQQFGALPCRSATDLITTLIHDIEEAWSRRLKVSMLTLDIKGAFDAVLPAD